MSAHSTATRCTPPMSSYRGVVLRLMPPRPPDDPLCRPRRRVRSPSRGASKVDVIVGPERTRHIVAMLQDATMSITSIPARWESSSAAPKTTCLKRESVQNQMYRWKQYKTSTLKIPDSGTCRLRGMQSESVPLSRSPRTFLQRAAPDADVQ